MSFIKSYYIPLLGVLLLLTWNPVDNTKDCLSINYKACYDQQTTLVAVEKPGINGSIPKEFQFSFQKTPSPSLKNSLYQSLFSKDSSFIKCNALFDTYKNIYECLGQQTKEQLTALIFPFHNYT